MKSNRPSATALFVANGMYYNIHCKHLNKDVPENYRKHYSELIEHFYSIKTPFKRRMHLIRCSLSQRFTIDGFFLHFLLRKKCIEKHVLKAIQDGAEQVIILGAGYDTLCVGLADKFPKIKFIEVDHPATGMYKDKLFSELKWSRSNLVNVPHDLKNSDGLFSNPHFDKGAKTMFVCEGVFMYLKQREVEELFQSIRINFKRKCGFMFTFMNKRGPDDYMFRDAHPLTKYYLKFSNEAFKWGIEMLKLEGFLDQQGWKLLDIFDEHRLRTEFLSPSNLNLPLAIGEHVVNCETISNGK